MLTNIKDIDDQILLYLDGRTLCHFKSINKVANNYFDVDFWRKKFQYDNIPVVSATTLYEYSHVCAVLKTVKIMFIIRNMNNMNAIWIRFPNTSYVKELISDKIYDDIENILTNKEFSKLYIQITLQIDGLYKIHIYKLHKNRQGTSGITLYNSFNFVYNLLFKAYYNNLLIEGQDDIPYIVNKKDKRDIEFTHDSVLIRNYYLRYGQYQSLSYLPDDMLNTLYHKIYYKI